jgi:putative transposase
MARLPRLFAASQPQHVIQRGLQGQPIFSDDTDYLLFTQLLRDAVREHNLAVHAYVLMPNHLHLLVTPPDALATGKVLQAVGRRYVLHFNRKTGRSGSLWDGRYRSTLIDPARYLFFCSRYIELNPVRAGLVSEAKDYRWSSYAHHIGLQPNPLLTDHALYWALGNTPFERQGRYRALFEQELDAHALQQLRDATNKGWAWGDEAFLDQIGTASNRRLSPLAKGRPIRTPP